MQLEDVDPVKFSFNITVITTDYSFNHMYNTIGKILKGAHYSLKCMF